MYSDEKKKIALNLLKETKSVTKTIRILGYPTNVSGTDDKLLLNLLKILNKVKTLELKKVVGLKKYLYILTRNHF